MAVPSRSDFIDKVASFVAARFPLVAVERNDAEFTLRINGQWTSLENVYRLALQNPDMLERQVERLVVELLRLAEGSPDEHAPFDEVKPRILPMLLGQGPSFPAGPTMIAQDLVAGLKVAYALDSERTIAYISRKMFAAWDIEIDKLHEIALANLVARSDAIQAHAAQDEAGNVSLILIQTMDGYDASRILLPGLHDRLRPHLGSPFLTGVPNRDILVCFRDEPDMRQRMSRQIAEDYRTMPHQVSNRLFMITPDGIAPYEETL